MFKRPTRGGTRFPVFIGNFYPPLYFRVCWLVWYRLLYFAKDQTHESSFPPADRTLLVQRFYFPYFGPTQTLPQQLVGKYEME